jgi:hypothetical protein
MTPTDTDTTARSPVVRTCWSKGHRIQTNPYTEFLWQLGQMVPLPEDTPTPAAPGAAVLSLLHTARGQLQEADQLLLAQIDDSHQRRIAQATRAQGPGELVALAEEVPAIRRYLDVRTLLIWVTQIIGELTAEGQPAPPPADLTLRKSRRYG